MFLHATACKESYILILGLFQFNSVLVSTNFLACLSSAPGTCCYYYQAVIRSGRYFSSFLYFQHFAALILAAHTTGSSTYNTSSRSGKRHKRKANNSTSCYLMQIHFLKLNSNWGRLLKCHVQTGHYTHKGKYRLEKHLKRFYCRRFLKYNTHIPQAGQLSYGRNNKTISVMLSNLYQLNFSTDDSPWTITIVYILTISSQSYTSCFLLLTIILFIVHHHL